MTTKSPAKGEDNASPSQGDSPETVAQVSNLLYRRFPIGSAHTGQKRFAHLTDLTHLTFLRPWSFVLRHSTVAVATLAILSLLILNTFRREGYTGDEGFYGVTALNMVHSPSYILRPSYYPMGDFAADKDGFAHPPFNSYFYALSLWLFRGSLAGPELVNVIAFALLLFFSYRLLQLFDRNVAIFATLLIAASPVGPLYYSQLEAEPLMTTFGIAALYFALRGSFTPSLPQEPQHLIVPQTSAERGVHAASMNSLAGASIAELLLSGDRALKRRERRAPAPFQLHGHGLAHDSDLIPLAPSSPRPTLNLFISGLCLGFAFALKLWLFGPFVLAVAMGLIICSLPSGAFLGNPNLLERSIAAINRCKLRRSDIFVETSQAADPSSVRSGILFPLVLFALGALIPAGIHLLAIVCVYPADLPFWLKNIYFGIFTNAGISGSKLEGGGVPADWIHPFWYYGAALYRDHFFLLPIILLGLGSALRDQKLRGKLLWITLAGIAGLLPLSLIKVKEPLYVLSCSIFLYFLAGICLAALVRRISSGAKLDKFSTHLAPLGILAMLLLVPLAFTKGVQPGKITGAFVIAHSITFTITLAAFFWSQRKTTGVILQRVAYAACAVALLATSTYTLITRQPRDRVIAALIQPYVKTTAPNAVSFIASNFKCYQFYTFHRGCYWHELPAGQGPETLLPTPDFRNVQAFIIDSEDQQKPSVMPWLRWLEQNAVEKTSDVNTRLDTTSGFRLFVLNDLQRS